MKKINLKRIASIVIVVIGISLIILGIIFSIPKESTTGNKETVAKSKQTKIIEEKLDILIKDITRKNASSEELNKKYSSEDFNNHNVVFNEQNILTFKPHLEVKEELKSCLTTVDKNYENIYRKYLENLKYKVEVDYSNEAINLKIKTMYLSKYVSVMTNATDDLLPDPGSANVFDMFEARCKVILAMSNTLDYYNNKDEYLSIRLKYQLDDEKLSLNDYNLLSAALTSNNYIKESDEEFVKKESNRIVKKIKKEEK